MWGVSVVADSAQFSSAVSELAPPGTAGSALSVQTAVGFTLTSVTILGVGLLDPTGADGWRLAWIILALGPVVGIVAMVRLRHRPDATRWPTATDDGLRRGAGAWRPGHRRCHDLMHLDQLHPIMAE